MNIARNSRPVLRFCQYDRHYRHVYEFDVIVTTYSLFSVLFSWYVFQLLAIVHVLKF